jgi:hypothetical protein
MLQAGTWQRRMIPRPATWGLRRWLVLLLVLAISTSGFVRVPMDDHAASLSHEIASVGQEATGEPHCADEAHGATCCIASVCSFCIALISSAAITAATAAEVIETPPDEVHLSRPPSPGFRPPKLSANV